MWFRVRFQKFTLQCFPYVPGEFRCICLAGGPPPRKYLHFSIESMQFYIIFYHYYYYCICVQTDRADNKQKADEKICFQGL